MHGLARCMCLHKIYAHKMHVYEIHAHEISICRGRASHSLRSPSHRPAYHCVGWHAVMCYGAPEWFRAVFNGQPLVSANPDLASGLDGEGNITSASRTNGSLMACLYRFLA